MEIMIKNEEWKKSNYGRYLTKSDSHGVLGVRGDIEYVSPEDLEFVDSEKPPINSEPTLFMFEHQKEGLDELYGFPVDDEGYVYGIAYLPDLDVSGKVLFRSKGIELFSLIYLYSAKIELEKSH